MYTGDSYQLEGQCRTPSIEPRYMSGYRSFLSDIYSFMAYTLKLGPRLIKKSLAYLQKALSFEDLQTYLTSV